MVTAVQGYLNNSGMGGLPDLLTGGLAYQPDYNPTYLDPYTNEVIGNEAAEGNETQQQIIDKELYGTSSTGPNATGGTVAQQQAAMGGQTDPNVTAALNNRAGRLYDSQYNQLKAQATANAPAIQGQLINQGVGALQQQQDVGNQINDTQMQVIANQNALRNQVISQLFGAGGQFAGTMAGMKDQGPGWKNNPGSAGSQNFDQSVLDSNAQAPSDAQFYNQGTPGIPGQVNPIGTGPYGYGNPGQDGNGYYGNTPPNIGYGLGRSYNGMG